MVIHPRSYNWPCQAAPKSGAPPSVDDTEVPEEHALREMEDGFFAWDLNDNGRLSWSEMRKNVADASIKGDQAVALATLYTLLSYDAAFRGVERIAPLPFERIFDLYIDYTNEEDVSVAEKFHADYSKKLNSASSELFPQGAVDPYQAKQGTGPSCGFLAATFSHFSQRPEAAKQAIKELPDGMLSVKFPGVDKPIKVAPPTETEVTLFSGSGSNGLWINTLEKAWGVHQKPRNSLAAFEQTTYPEDIIMAWTDGKAVTTRIPKNPMKLESGTIPHFLRTVDRALDKDHLVVAWTRNETEEENFVPGHAYSVMDMDAQDGTITLRNPWGKGEPLNEEGEALDGKNDGVFDYPLGNFHKRFAKVARQTA